MKRVSYQLGSVQLEPRVSGPGVWVFLYRDATGSRKKVRIGTEDKFPTKSKAEKAAFALRAEINERMECIFFEDLVTRYEKAEMAVRASTAASYKSALSRLREQFGKTRVDALAKDMVGMQNWLKELQTKPTKNKPARPMSKKSKKALHSMLQILFECAIQWQYIPLARNPMELVKIKGPEVKKRVITLVMLDHYHKLLTDKKLPPMLLVLIELATCTGLRISEILGLRWDDVDFNNLTIYVKRSVVGRNEAGTKTEGSEEYIPLHEDLAATLVAWREFVPSVNGWMFGNIQTGRPFWRDSLQDDHLKPAGIRVGIESLGWHNFRHTYRKMLKDSDTPLEVQQKLMRHASITTTMNYGKDSMLDLTRPANAKVVAMRPKPVRQSCGKENRRRGIKLIRKAQVSVSGTGLEPGPC